MNPQVELAKRRNRIAADRTLLSWVRTSLTLIGIGFGTDKVVEALLGSSGEVSQLMKFAHLLGLALVGLGTYAVFSAAVDYHKELNKLQQENYFYTPRHSLSTTVAIVLIMIATGALIKIFS